MTPSAIPQWLSKSSSDSYILSVLKTLASRDGEREIARHLSAQPNAETGHSEPSVPRFGALSRILKSSRPSEAISTPDTTLLDHYSVSVGCSPNNQARNRYMDIHPYDRTRVVVNDNRKQSISNAQGRYLNASWVLERYGQKWWIASQAPLPNTAHTFLSLLFQPTSPPPPPSNSQSSPYRASRVRTIVQLTNEIEGGRRKAHPYFPSTIGQSIIIQPERGDESPALKVTLSNREVIETASCVLSTVSVTPIALPQPPSGPDAIHTEYIQDDIVENSAKGDNLEGNSPSIIFRHMLYTAWPDHGVPKASNRASLLAFLRLVDSTNRDVSLTSTPDDPEVDLDPPIIVGCSAGIGRTGTFIAISSILRNYGFLPPPGTPSDPSVLPASPLGAIPPDLNDDLVVQEIDSLREQRPRMVERNEQVILIYEMLTSAFAT